MTDQEINEAIAEVTGANNLWLVCKYGLYYRPGGHGYTSDERDAWKLSLEEAKKHEYLRGYKPVTLKKASIPNYFYDLNAMHEAEEAILKNDDLFQAYDAGLHHEVYPAWNASARQRAEVFVKTIRKWSDA